MRDDDLTVAEAAEALGTSPQSVRALLRKGELRGRKRPWGKRFVWVPSREGVDEFLSQNGRLEGRRRSRAPQPARADETGEVAAVPAESPPLYAPPPLRSASRP